jgi:hypothetical protein
VKTTEFRYLRWSNIFIFSPRTERWKSNDLIVMHGGLPIHGKNWNTCMLIVAKNYCLIMIHDRNIPEYLWLVPSPWMQGFFKNSSAGWGIRKTRGPYWVHGEMTDVLEWCCIGLRVFFPRNVLYFSTPRTAFRAFYETDFWYTAFKLYCIAR